MRRIGANVKILKPILTLLLLLTLSNDPSTAGDNLPKKPHLLVDVSAALINAAVQRSVDRTDPVEEEIQDTPVRGMGRTVGTIRAELIPDGRRAAVDLVFQGGVWSRTVGARGTIRIHTVTATPFDVRRRITVDEKGIHAFDGPACAVASTKLLNITSTMDFDRLAMQIAREGYKRRERDAEVEASVKTTRKLVAGLADELSPTLASASQAMGRELLSYRRVGLSLEGLGFNTTPAFLQAALRFDLPARSQPDRILPLPADIDLGMRIHESVANEAAQTELGGHVFELGGVSKLYGEITRGLIRDGRKNADKKGSLQKIEKAIADLAGHPVAVTLAQKDPVTVAFADNGFSVEIRVAKVRQDKVTFAGLRIKAAYRFENLKDGVQAVRSGPIQFFPEKGQPEQKIEALPAPVLLLLEVLAPEVLTDRVILNPLPMPATLTSLRLQPPRAFSGDGWFALTWKLVARPGE